MAYGNVCHDEDLSVGFELEDLATPLSLVPVVPMPATLDANHQGNLAKFLMMVMTIVVVVVRYIILFCHFSTGLLSMVGEELAKDFTSKRRGVMTFITGLADDGEVLARNGFAVTLIGLINFMTGFTEVGRAVERASAEKPLDDLITCITGFVSADEAVATDTAVSLVNAGIQGVIVSGGGASTVNEISAPPT